MATDFGVQDPNSTVVRLRDDLVMMPRQFGGQSCYIIEDARARQVLPRRRRRVHVHFTARRPDDDPPSDGVSRPGRWHARARRAPALAVCRWLVECQLASTGHSATADKLVHTARQETRQRWRSRFNPLVIKFPLGNPDRLLRAALPYVSWMLTRRGFALWLVLVSWALLDACDHWTRLATACGVIFAPGNRWLLVAAWVGLKVVHETFHGLTCKKYGGQVPSAGVMLIALAPVAFVDVTSSWRIRSKWQRIAIAAAGIYSELAIASAALIVWAHSRPGTTGQLALNIAVLASVNTLVFNANPLLRFDGYYMLADLLEIPNLYPRGQQYVGWWARKYILGQPVALPPAAQRERRIIQWYGILAFAWRVLLFVLLSLTLVGLLGPLGGVLGVALVASAFGAPAWRGVRDAWRSASRRPCLLGG